MSEIDFDNLKSDAELAEAKTTKEPKVELPVEEVEEEVSEEVAEEATESDEESDDESGDEVEEGKPEAKGKKPWGTPDHTPKGVREKFSKLTTKNRELEAKVKQMEEAFNRLNPQNNQQRKMPTKQDFINAGRTEEDYIAFLVQVQTQQQVQALEQQRMQREVQTKQAEEISGKWESAMEKAKADLPDYDDVVAEADLKLPVQTMRYLAVSDVGPYIAYTIAKDKTIHQNIAQLSPADRHNAVLQVEQMVRNWLSAPKAKAPVTPVQPQPQGSSKPRPPMNPKVIKGKQKLDPATASIEEWLGIQ
jgi:hypothetical protein